MLYIPIQQRHPLLWKPSIVRNESKTLTYLPKKAWALRSHWRRMLLMVLLWLVLRGRRGSVPRLCRRRRHRMHSSRPTRSSRARGRARRSRRTRRSRHGLTESSGKLSHAPTLHPCTEHRVARATNVVQIIRPIRTNFFSMAHVSA